jgi:hypothetical protein
MSDSYDDYEAKMALAEHAWEVKTEHDRAVELAKAYERGWNAALAQQEPMGRMNREEIIRMARDAGLVRAGDKWVEPARWGVTEIERFAALIAAAEREACAKVCDVLAVHPEYASDITKVAAKAIRARGEK